MVDIEDTVTLTREQALKLVDKSDSLGELRALLETVVPTIGCDGAIAVPWRGIWLCIETDGYCHS